MKEEIYTFTDEEVAGMLKSGQMKVLTTPAETVEKTPQEKALEKAKKLFGDDFEDVFTLGIGGKTPGNLKSELKKDSINILPWAEYILDAPEFDAGILPNPQDIVLIKLKVKDLGFENGASIERIYLKALEFGLGLCPAEVGPYLELKNFDWHKDINYWIAMEPIRGCIFFSLNHPTDKRKMLHISLVDNGTEFRSSGELIFSI